MKKFRYLLEAIPVGILLIFFRILTQKSASRIGSKMARIIGPKLKQHRIATQNIKRAFPDITNAELERILTGMWDNLGRVAGEFSHIPQLIGDKFDKYVEVTGLENVTLLADKNKPFILFSAHLGNWEIAPQTAFAKGFPLSLVYRKANNPHVDKLFQGSREQTLKNMYPKGKEAARGLLKSLKNGDPVGMLIDQKFNEGVPIPFFGHDAMTAPAIAEFALKYNIPVFPARVIRKGTSFHVEISPAMNVKNKSTEDILKDIHHILEGWITEHPEQWFWVHNRWPKESFTDLK